MARKQRDPVREQLWRTQIALWQASQLTVRAFCLQHRIALSTFQYWIQELRRRDAEPTIPSTPATPTFIPVTVLPPELNPVSLPPISTPNICVQVQCPSGHQVSFSLLDPSLLPALFAALHAQEKSC